MEPISTAILVAAFMMPLVPTRLSTWAPTRSIQSTFDQSEETVSTALLVSPVANSSTSERFASPGWTGNSQSSDKLQWLAEELELYGDLKDGWNGPDSFGPKSEDIATAHALLSRIPAGFPLPKAMVASSGSIGLYWNTELAFADIEIESKGRFSLFTRQKIGAQEETFHDDESTNTLTSAWLAKRLAILASN